MRASQKQKKLGNGVNGMNLKSTDVTNDNLDRYIRDIGYKLPAMTFDELGWVRMNLASVPNLFPDNKKKLEGVLELLAAYSRMLKDQEDIEYIQSWLDAEENSTSFLYLKLLVAFPDKKELAKQVRGWIYERDNLGKAINSLLNLGLIEHDGNSGYLPTIRGEEFANNYWRGVMTKTFRFRK